MITFRAYNIKWDTDGEPVELPTEVLINLDTDLDNEEVEQELSDEVSNMTGFCHKGFKYEVIE